MRNARVRNVGVLLFGAVLSGGAAASIAGEICPPGWSATGAAFSDNGPLGHTINDLQVVTGGSGSALYAAGDFTSVAGQLATGVARWDGAAWTPLVGGQVPQYAIALAEFDDGTGPALYVAGRFVLDDGSIALLARWTGSEWALVPSVATNDGGPELVATELAVFDDGTGAQLYVGGFFRTVDGVTVNHLARWNGSTWSAVGGGVFSSSYVAVGALFPYDDGTGTALYVGGTFTHVGQPAPTGLPARHVARWTGLGWSAVGTNISGTDPRVIPTVMSFAVYEENGQPTLFAGGAFDGNRRVRRWNGQTWSDVGIGSSTGSPNAAASLAVFDDGSGEKLFVGGNFRHLSIEHIESWDGQNWEPLPGTLRYRGRTVGSVAVRALQVFDDPDGPALFVGGQFDEINGLHVRLLARYGCVSADLNCDARLDFGDVDPFILALFDPPGYDQQFPDCDRLKGDLDHDGVLSFTDVDAFLDRLFAQVEW